MLNPRRELEPRWVSEFMKETFPRAEVRLRVPLGPIPKETQATYGLMKGLRVYRPWRPEVDAAANWNKNTIIVEAKIFKYMDGLSKLPVYKSLLDTTPELKSWPETVEMMLLIPAPIAWVIAAAKDQQIKVVSDYVPQYIKQAWEERDKYWTKEAVQAREDRKARMHAAGLS